MSYYCNTCDAEYSPEVWGRRCPWCKDSDYSSDQLPALAISADVHYGCNDSAKPFEHHWVLCRDMHSPYLDHLTKTSDIDRVTCQDCQKHYRRLEPLLHHTHFLHRGSGFYVLQIPCHKSLDYPSFSPIPSTCDTQEVTCPRCQKYVVRLMKPRPKPRTKITAVRWCTPCNRWWMIQATERQMRKPHPCPTCTAILADDSSNSKNPLPHIHVSLARVSKGPTDATLLRCINRHLAHYPAESIYTGDKDLGFYSSLTIDTPRKCHDCKYRRREERRHKQAELRHKALVKWYMDEEDMTNEQAENAACKAWIDARDRAAEDAHEAWLASVDSDEDEWS